MMIGPRSLFAGLCASNYVLPLLFYVSALGLDWAVRGSDRPAHYCDNGLVTGVMVYYVSEARQHGIAMDVRLDLRFWLAGLGYDVWVNMVLAEEAGNHVVFEIRNTFAGPSASPRSPTGLFLTTRNGMDSTLRALRPSWSGWAEPWAAG